MSISFSLKILLLGIRFYFWMECEMKFKGYNIIVVFLIFLKKYSIFDLVCENKLKGFWYFCLVKLFNFNMNLFTGTSNEIKILFTKQ